MTERVFKLEGPTSAFDIDKQKAGEGFYDRLAAKFLAVGYEAGWDAGSGKLPVKLCLQGYAHLRVTWDETALPELAGKIDEILAGVVKREPEAKIDGAQHFSPLNPLVAALRSA